MEFLSGKKTYILVIIAFMAQAVSYLKPEYKTLADQVSVYALGLTPVTIRSAIVK
jgi:hypothetical protein